MIEWLFAFLVFYLLYKLIFDLILPVSRASSQIRRKVNEMNAQQHKQYPPHQNKTQQPHAKPPADDYIDYEEVK